MKKILIFSMLLFLIKGHTQTNPADETITLDQMLTNVNQSSVTSGIIYERVAQFANLYNFNVSDSLNIADFKYFKQALSEMHRASNKTKFISVEELNKRLEPNLYDNTIIDMAILNTPFQILNYNEANPTAGGLTFNATTNRFDQISGKVPFYTLHATVISPTKEIVGAGATFKWSNSLIFQNTTKTIKNLTCDYGTGTTYNVITNYVLVTPTQQIYYSLPKTLKFTYKITYSDNTTLTTYSEIECNSKRAVRSKSCGSNYGLVEDRDITSNYPFKGYDETFAFKGFIKCRIFYKNNTDGKVRKPIIIVDGFDPQDKRKILPCDYENGKYDGRSIADIMKYTDHDGTTKDLITELQQKGFDVIIVNQPSYAVMKTPPYQVVARGTAGSREVDGGADYIERNALNLATLITQVNKEVKDNGSTEKLVIVGPSMGGQISRYALAWMEKNNIPHNTRLWVSVDSPHLGANIPMGDQALLNFLKEESEDAKDFYNNQLKSVAAKQQLIEQHKQGQVFLPIFNKWFENSTKVDNNSLNGKTIAQGFTSNSGESFFQTYYNNLFTNGLAGSKGYPQNLRKIALTNGSLTGERIGKDNEKVLNIKGFQKLRILWINFDVHIASLECYFMPSFGVGEQSIARFKAGFKDRTTKASNLNSRGNMDSVPGGWFPTQNELAGSILAKKPIESKGSFWEYPLDNIIYGISKYLGGSYFELRDFRFNNSFIPTFSSLGMLNPNQDWGSPLNRNLVCSKEIPFDSYYGETQNTQHTSFNANSISWLFKELGDETTSPIAQVPYFPISENNLIGENQICANITTTYTFGSNCKIPSNPIWSVSSNLQIISSSSTTIAIKGLSKGDASITATFQNGQQIIKKIFIGTPEPIVADSPYGSFSLGSISKIDYYIKAKGTDSTTKYKVCYGLNSLCRDIDYVTLTSNRIYKEFNPPITSGFYFWTYKTSNKCGWSEPYTESIFVLPFSNFGEQGLTEYSISPNPANSILNIELSDKSLESFECSLHNVVGNTVDYAKSNNGKITLNTFNLPNGIYTLNLIKNGIKESQQVEIKH